VDHRLHDGVRPLTELRNPFRREADAFRLLVIVGVAAMLVIVVTVAVNATAGALLGLIFVLLGGSMALKWLRLQLEKPDDER
jgi:hypothetical protein